MDFRKLDIDKVVLDKRSSNFIEFLSELLIPFRVFAKERHIDICTYFRLENPFLMIDTGYMRKVLVNLVSNAIKFTRIAVVLTYLWHLLKERTGRNYSI